jgi:polyisoprenoid-binding protein YceI
MSTQTTEIAGYLSGSWQIDPVHTEISFLIRHMMISKVRGRFDRFEGTIVTAADPLQSTATASIDLTSINTSNDMRDNHIRSADFFDVENHPTMTFVSTAVRPAGDGFELDGELTLRGVTKPLTLAVEINGFGPDGRGGTRAGFSASGKIDRTDFGVSYNGPIPGGGSVLSDSVTLNIEVEAVLQP